MLAYLEIEGATAGKDAQTFKPTSEGLAMAHVPGWVMLLDPDYIDSKGVLNRCVKGNVAAYMNATTANLAAFTNGQTAFNPIDSKQLRINPDIDFPTDAWSLVFVAKPDVKAIADMNMIVTSNEYSTETVKVGVGFHPSSGSLRVMKSGALSTLGVRMIYSPESGLLSDFESVYIVTGSTKNGLSIYKNGVLVASNQDTSAVTEGWQAGEWHVLRGARGLFGMIGLLSIDLNDQINEGFRNQINGFLMEKYEISA